MMLLFVDSQVLIKELQAGIFQLCVGASLVTVGILYDPIYYPKSETPGERRYNRSFLQSRKTIECAFRLWRSRWRSMHGTGGTLCYAPHRACRFATMVLHNMMLMEKRMKKLYIMILPLVALLFTKLQLINILIKYDLSQICLIL